MSLRRILNEYIEEDWGKGFKGVEYFKFIIPKNSIKWVESEISKHLIEPNKLTSDRNLSLYTHGTQYIIMNYDSDKRLIMRMSTHKENRSKGDNSHYSINGWDTNKRELKEHINEFIDYGVIYFNGVEKLRRDEKISEIEQDVINIVESGELFYEDNKYPRLDIVHRKAIKKKLNNTPPNMIRLP